MTQDILENISKLENYIKGVLIIEEEIIQIEKAEKYDSEEYGSIYKVNLLLAD